MSKTTSSPVPISRSPGSACGRAPFSPAAMIGGKDGSAPSSRIRASQARATSRSVRPARPRSIVHCEDTVGELGRGGHPLDLLGLLHGAELLDEVTRRDELDVLADRRLQPGELPDAQLGVLEADPARHPRGDLRDQLALGLGALPLLPDLALRRAPCSGSR